MEGVTLSQYKAIIKSMLKDFDITLNEETRRRIEACETQREVNRIKDELINKRLEEDL